jgi:hypothetical protein
MKNRLSRVLVIGLLLAIAALPAASPALAMPPTSEKFEDFYSDPVYDCGAFMLIETVHATYHITTFFDNTGAPVRRQVQFSYDGTVANSVTGEYVTDAPDHALYVRDYQAGTLAIHGLVLSANIPGVGVVSLDAGTTVYDAAWDIVFQSGPHHVLLPGYAVDYSAICEVLR